MANRVEWILSVCLVFLATVLGDPASKKIYVQLHGENICFRRLNATHQVGCTSKSGGSVGVLQLVNTSEELNEVLTNGQFYPYVIALRYRNFSSSTLHLIQASKKASGVLILFADEKLSKDYEFSPDQSCPNANFGMYRGNLSQKECRTKWNPSAQSTLFENWDFPIFAIRDKGDIEEIEKCYANYSSFERQNAGKWPLCAAELRSYMLAAKDAKTCIRRSKLNTNIHHTLFCRPLGDQNIWSTLLPLNKSTPIENESMIIVAAKFDAASMFDGLSPGADSTVTGLVTLLAVAEQLFELKKSLPLSVYQKNVMFVLFNGESFDYIGSSKMVYDMEQNRFPAPVDDPVSNQSTLIHLNSISHFIEVNQLSQSKEIFVHYDNDSRASAAVNNKIAHTLKILKQTLSRKSVHMKESVISTLPAASLQTFLRKNNEIAGVVLSNYDDKYKNMYYNSMFDIASTIMDSWSDEDELFKHIAKVSSAIAEAVHLLATEETVDISINSTRIRDLSLCYMNTTNCTLFRESVSTHDAELLKNVTLPLYVSVDLYSNAITRLTWLLFARLTGDRLQNVTQSECSSKKDDQVFRYFWMPGLAEAGENGICIRSTANVIRAVSPAFEIDGYDFDSGEYSTWTESEWQQTSIRIFLKPSKAWEVTVLMTGASIFILSFLCVWVIDRNAKTLFPRSQVGL